jgi:hypothetical protein
MRSTKAPTIRAGRDDSEGHLEHEKHALGNAGVRRNGLPREAEQESLVEITDPRTHTIKSKAIASEQPKHRDKAGDSKAMHHHREHVSH